MEQTMLQYTASIISDNFTFSFSVLLFIVNNTSHNYDCICKHIANRVFICDVATYETIYIY